MRPAARETTALNASDDTLRPPLVAWLYFATGYIALPFAFAAVAVAPARVGGFFYHPRLIGIVHLVTLGWITSLLVGAIYAGVPGLKTMPQRVRRGEYWVLATFVIGLIGMVAHFWIEEFGGMAWSGAMVLVALVHVGGRVARTVRRERIDGAARLHVVLAFANIGLAATAGVVIGFDKVYHFLPGYVIANVLAHAHLAALGWAAMLATGLVYLLQSSGSGATPSVTSAPRSSAWLLQAASLGLFAGLALQTPWAIAAAMCGVAAFVRIVAHGTVLWRARPHAGGPVLTAAACHLVQAFAYAFVAAGLGIALLILPPSDLTMRLALVYGVAGLGGFLAQLVLGVQSTVEPRLRARWGTFALWSLAVPVLATGFLWQSDATIAAGAWIGFAASAGQAAVAVSEWLWNANATSWHGHDEGRRSAA